MQTISQQQKKSKDYSIKQEVLAVVVLTQPYIVNKKTGEAIQNNVLKLDFDLKNLDGKVINIWGHNLIFFNSKYKDPTIPARYEDCLSLIRESIKNNEKISEKAETISDNRGHKNEGDIWLGIMAYQVVSYIRRTLKEKKTIIAGQAF